MSHKISLLSTEVYPPNSGVAYRSWIMAKLLNSFSNLTVFESKEKESDPPKNFNADFFSQNIIKNDFISKISRLTTYWNTNYYPFKKELTPDAIQIESLDLFHLRKYFPDIPVVYDGHNIYWDLLKEIYIEKSFSKKLISPWLLRVAKNFEVNVLCESDHVIATTDLDKDIMVKYIDKEKITVIPNCVELEKYPKPNPIEGNIKILFIGLLTYIPNLDAVKIICEKIAPKFSDEILFEIVGKNPPHIENKPKNVRFTGFVTNIIPNIAEATVCIAPLRYGGGSRIKILEYMTLGKPVVSTSKGAEGLWIKDNEDILISDDFDEFCEKIDYLLNNRDQAESIGKNARNTIEKRYDYRVYKNDIKKIYEKII
jgi:glycosyltransferase involved in cell wall biosynthesis